MTAATREFALWAVFGVVGMIVVVLVRSDEPFSEPRDYVLVPLVGLVVGAAVVLRTRLLRRARRRGAEARGMTLEESEAQGREAERRFAVKHPILYGLAWIGLLVLIGGLLWLKVAT